MGTATLAVVRHHPALTVLAFSAKLYWIAADHRCAKTGQIRWHWPCSPVD